MTLANPSKALILLVALICVTVLMALGKISAEAGLPVITAFGGYGIGNGIAARAGKSADPILGPKQHD
jgi:hypothetical protein